MKIGIVTYHSAKNYGAILQCYALQNVLDQCAKYDVHVVNYTPNVFYDYFPNPRKICDIKSNKTKLFYLMKWIFRKNQTEKESQKYDKLSSFINSKLFLTKEVQREELKNLNDEFDIFIAGSDQIWNLEMTNRDTTFLLDFTNNKKISYAASTKISKLNSKDIELLKKHLRSFSHISVRETDACEYFNNIGIKAECDLDPTLLLERSNWEDLIKQTTLDKSNYVLIYYVNAPDQLIIKAFDFAKKNGLKVVSLNRLNSSFDYCDYSNASIEEFILLIKNANCVFTTSFHGFVFSIIFNKNFFFETPNNSKNNNQRLLDLAMKLGVESQSLQSNNSFELNIQWEFVNNILNKLRKESIKRLYNYIDN